MASPGRRQRRGYPAACHRHADHRRHRHHRGRTAHRQDLRRRPAVPSGGRRRQAPRPRRERRRLHDLRRSRRLLQDTCGAGSPVPAVDKIDLAISK